MILYIVLYGLTMKPYVEMGLATIVTVTMIIAVHNVLVAVTAWGMAVEILQ